jgi:TRAP-type C4-dicarboxylate transport system permease small subunit
MKTEIHQFLDSWNTKAAAVGSATLFLLLLLVVLQVASRYFFNSPINGTVELIEFLMIFVVFLGFGKCELENGNVKVELLISHIPDRFRHAIGLFNLFVCSSLIFLLIWQNVLQIKLSYESNLVSGLLHIPHYPFYIVLVAGYLLLFVVLFMKFCAMFSGVIRNWNQ